MTESDVCRICRGEETNEEPLYHPCKCSGSIQYVHQECLLEWLDHATSIRGLKAECDLCKQPYQLRKKFRRDMPATMQALDYAKYWLKMARKHGKVVYYAARAVAMILFLTVFVDIATSALMNFPNEHEVSIKASALKVITGTCLPGNSVVSKAPYIDYLLNFVTKPGCRRASVIHGFLLIGAFVLVVFFVWIVWMWLIEDEVVLHDVAHIMRGEIAHMDKGDEDALFDFISDADTEEPPREEPNVMYVDPSVEVSPALAQVAESSEDEESEPIPEIETSLPLFVRLTESKVFLYTLDDVAQFDPEQPHRDLILAEDFLATFPNDPFRFLLTQRMAVTRLQLHNYDVLLETREGKRVQEEWDRLEPNLSVDTTIHNLYDFETELHTLTAPRPKTSVLMDIAVTHQRLRISPPLSDEFAALTGEKALLVVPPPIPIWAQRHGIDSAKYGANSCEYIAKLGLEFGEVFDRQELMNEVKDKFPDTETSFMEPKEPRPSARAILSVPGDLYADKEDFTEEMRAMWRENEEDGGDFQLLLFQVAGFLGRPNLETLKALYFILASLILTETVCGTVYYLTLNVYQLLSLAVYVLLTDTPVSYFRNFFPSQLAAQFLAGFEYSPTSLKGRLMVMLTMTVVLNTALRYVVLLSMNMLLKSANGRSFVRVYYEYYVVLKTIIMTLVETLAFPIFCGAIIHLVGSPLGSPALPVSTASWTEKALAIGTSSLSWHNKHYRTHLGTTVIVQWITGYIYMHALQVMVAGCRKVMRQGVLFFLQDADTASFLKTMLQVSLPKQIYRISVSGGIYGVLIILGMGSVTVALRLLEPSVWPLNLTYWPGLELLRMWWVVIIGRALFTRLLMSSGQRSPRTLNYVFFTLWLRERVWLRILETCSRSFDLQSWLFSVPKEIDEATKQALATGDQSRGYFVRAPYEKKLRSLHKLQLFVPVDEQDRRLDGKIGVMDREVKVYTVVWRPRYFRIRLAGFALYVWASVTVIVLLLTLVPLRLGRLLDAFAWDHKIRNDLVLFLGGLAILLPVYGMLIYRFPPRELSESLRFKTVVGRLPYPSLAAIGRGSDVVLAVLISLLGLAVHAEHTSSALYPWLLIALRPNFPMLLTAAVLIANAAGYVFLFHAVQQWTESAVHVNYTLLAESALILVGRGPHNWYTQLSTLLVSAFIVYRIWRRSVWRQKLMREVQETNYLEGVEVVNYPKS